MCPLRSIPMPRYTAGWRPTGPTRGAVLLTSGPAARPNCDGRPTPEAPALGAREPRHNPARTARATLYGLSAPAKSMPPSMLTRAVPLKSVFGSPVFHTARFSSGVPGLAGYTPAVGGSK